MCGYKIDKVCQPIDCKAVNMCVKLYVADIDTRANDGAPTEMSVQRLTPVNFWDMRLY